MAKAVIAYDKDLPEIPGRLPLAPTSYLLKKKGQRDEFEIIETTSKPAPACKQAAYAVDEWREGYPGASYVTGRLFDYWFDEDHELMAKPSDITSDNGKRWRRLSSWWKSERSATPSYSLMPSQRSSIPKELTSTSGSGITLQTTMDGKRQIRRYVPEVARETIQDLPPADLSRYAFKMATGSGKTWVMAMPMVWSYFHGGSWQARTCRRTFSSWRRT